MLGNNNKRYGVCWRKVLEVPYQEYLLSK